MRPSCSNPRAGSRGSLQPGLATRVRRVEMAVEHQRRPAAVPGHVPSTFARPSSTCCHCTCSPVASNSLSSARRPPAPSREGRRRDEPQREVDQAALVDHRTCGRTFSANQSDLLVPLRAPQLQHDVRAAGVLVLLDRSDAVGGRARDRLALVEDASVTFSFAASRPPCSIASATGRISSCVSPARSSRVSAEPWMFCTLFARYMAAISRRRRGPRRGLRRSTRPRCSRRRCSARRGCACAGRRRAS